jgi:hypothetical protein
MATGKSSGKSASIFIENGQLLALISIPGKRSRQSARLLFTAS